MRHLCFRVPRSIFLSVLVALQALAVVPTILAATPLDTNLIVNGDAEASPAAATYNDVAAPSGWTTTSNFTALRYDATKPTCLKHYEPTHQS